MRISPCTAFIGDRQVLFDSSLFNEPPIHLFDGDTLDRQDLLTGHAAGRGQVWFFRYAGREMVLRHFRRGGLLRHFMHDSYLRPAARHSRSWREWQLLQRMYAQGLPVPRPVAAQARIRGPLYSADLITERIPGARSLAEHLRQAPLDEESWRRIGATVGLFHERDIWHSDLNAYNILLDDSGSVYLIDFDSGREGASGLGKRRNLSRLLRSLRKIRAATPFFAFDESFWQCLLQGYRNPHRHAALNPVAAAQEAQAGKLRKSGSL